MNLSSSRTPPSDGAPAGLVDRITDPALAAALSRFVRTRVPESEVDDIVQATLSDALQAAAPPDADEEIVRWIYGICRHKIVDWFRRTKREVPRDLDGDDAVAADSAPTGALDLMRWARKELPAGEEHEQTLEWMLREGEGEKLESIAAEANVPAPRVRQRVSRLRRYFKAKWAAQTAAVAALLLVGLAIFLALRGKKEEIAPRPEPSFEPSSLPLPPPSAPQLPLSLPAMSTEPPDADVPIPPLAPTTSAGPKAPRFAPTSTGIPTKPVPAPTDIRSRKANPPTKTSFPSSLDPSDSMPVPATKGSPTSQAAPQASTGPGNQK